MTGVKPLETEPGKYDESLFDDDGHVKRTGNAFTATSHIVTAVIGAGVLSLPWATAQMGWVFGPFCLMLFSGITLYTAYFLADAYRTPDPVNGKRNHGYMESVEALLGKWQVVACGAAQHFNLVGTAVGYTVTAAIAMVAIKKSQCFHANGHDSGCTYSITPYMIIFGGTQLVFSQVPDMDRLWWLSIVGAAMALTYSPIGLALCIAKATEQPGSPYGSGTWDGVRVGDDVTSWAEKTWAIFNALGSFAFAYSFSFVLIEIQDTLKSPPQERITMRRATTLSIAITTFFYASVGILGYAAFGNQVPGNILTGFGFYNPYWLIDIANLAIIIHLFGAYQVFSQPFFAFFESVCFKFFPNSRFLRASVNIPIGRGRVYELNFFRLVWRSLYVVFTTIIALVLPFFNDILGLLGAIGFWPLTVYFPVEMHIKQYQVPRWSPKWIWLQSLSFFCFLVSIAAGIGSIAYIRLDLQSYTPFQSKF